MELVLWRHAEAQEWSEGCNDLQRTLTAHGEKQAKRIAQWLDRQLPESARILCSPARRCQQTVLALGRKYEVCADLGPASAPEALLAAAGWPDEDDSVVLVVGHQPFLGQTVAKLMGIAHDGYPVRKSGLWWFRTRERDGATQTALVCVQAPEMLD